MKIWYRDDIGKKEFPALRYRVKKLVERFYPLEQLHNAEEFDADKAATKEFNELWDIALKMRAAHREYRREYSISRQHQRRSLEEPSLETMSLYEKQPRGGLRGLFRGSSVFRIG